MMMTGVNDGNSGDDNKDDDSGNDSKDDDGNDNCN